MKLTGINSNFTGANTAALAVPVFKNEKASSSALKDLDKLTGGLIGGLMKAEEFKGDAGQTAFLRFSPKGKVKASRLLLIGVGEKSDYKVSDVTAVSGIATRYFRSKGIKGFALLPRQDGDAVEI